MKRFGADFAFTDVFVAIHAAAERDFRIVGVKDGNAIEANCCVDYVDRRGQAGLTLDVVASGKKMRGVEAGGCWNTFKSSQDFCNFFETRADGNSHPCGVFDQDAQRCREKSAWTLA